MNLPLAIVGIDDAIYMVIIALIIAAASMVISELLRPKPKLEDARAAALGDFKFPTAIEGRVIPVVWGRVKLAGPNVVWYGDLEVVAIRRTIKTGLWDKKRLTTGHRYYIGLQMALCKGPVTTLHTIWVNDDVLDPTPTHVVNDTSFTLHAGDFFGGEEFGSGGIFGSATIYGGRDDQVVNPLSGYMKDVQNPLINYAGCCFVIWEGGYVGTSPTLPPWRFEVTRMPPALCGPIGDDANPIDILYEILVNTDWGFGFPASEIDAANFQVAGATLATEGNGFSLVVDTPKELGEIIGEIERQIDGVLYLDHFDGKFKVKLTRADYDIDTVPQLTSANVLEVKDFARGTWDETSNQVRIAFADRGDSYKETYSSATDLANQRIQLGATISATVRFPGCKTAALAAKLATRQLKYLSTPLSRATIRVDRSLWSIMPGDVVAWTDDSLGFTKLPMRVAKIDFGDALESGIELTLVEDIFQYHDAADGTSGNTLWTPPSNDAVAFPAAGQIAMEAPYALIRRDVDYPDVPDRLWVSGRRTTGAIAFDIYQRSAAGVPAGSFVEVGDGSIGFMMVGTLGAALQASDAQPTAVVRLDPGLDTVADMLAAFTAAPSLVDMGQNLVNLILVGDEFMAVQTITDQTTYLDLGNVYRGLLDSVPADHAAGVPVYLVFAGGMVTDDAIARGYNVDVQLRPQTRTDETTEAEATTMSLMMQDRCRRPYPATELTLNGVRYQASVNIDTMRAGGTTDDDKGIEITFRRKDFRNLDEVQSVGADAASFIGDFPAANSTQNNATLTDDPLGSPTTVESKSWSAGTSFFFSRTRMLAAKAGARPTSLRMEVGARHTYEGQLFEALQKLTFDFATAASEVDGWFNLGVLIQNAVSFVYNAPTTGSYGFSVGPNMGAGQVEARINGGGWTPVIIGGNRTGSLAGVTAGDTIEVRHTQASTGVETFLKVDAPASASDAYAVLQI